jgi:hypothetical protein
MSDNQMTYIESGMKMTSGNCLDIVVRVHQDKKEQEGEDEKKAER